MCVCLGRALKAGRTSANGLQAMCLPIQRASVLGGEQEEELVMSWGQVVEVGVLQASVGALRSRPYCLKCCVQPLNEGRCQRV